MTTTDLYIEAFKKIIKIVSNAKYENKDKLNAYSAKIAECLSPLLHRITYELKCYSNSKGHKFKLEKCLIKFNSIRTSTRVKIPFHGRYYESFDSWINSTENVSWKKTALSQDTGGIAYMYRNPEKPIHILTELMWRFQEKAKENTEKNDDFCLLVNRNNENSKFKFSKQKQNKYRIKVLDLETKTTDHDKKYTELADRLMALKPKNPKESRIPLEKDYDKFDAEKLLCDVMSFLDNEKTKKNKNSQSVFFLADLIEKDCMAGFEFVLGYEDESNMDMLPDFIHEIRWYLSKYIVELVNVAESIYVTRGEDIVYRDNFFYREPKKKENAAIDTIIKVFREMPDIKVGGHDEEDTFNEIKNIVLDHFKVANSGIGLYWTNYKHWSYQVARTVAKIIDNLFYPKCKDGKIEKVIQKFEIDLKGFNNALKSNKIPLVFKQLFRGLEREKELFLISNYRDHFIHSFYVFVMGLIILSTRNVKIFPSELKIDNSDNKDILKKWFIVAMCHDIAYILEKGEAVLEKYILSFMNPKRKKNVLPWVPSLGNLLQVEGLLDNIKEITGDNVISIPPSYPTAKVKARDVIVPVAFDDINHGIWSSLFVYHSLDDEDNNSDVIKDLFCDKENFRKNTILPICRAILPHHVSDWNAKEIIDGFTKNYEVNKNEWNKTRINPKENPLGCLLSLCDTLCQAGRDAPEMADEKEDASNLGIKFDEISFNTEKKILNVFISYEKFKGKDKKTMFKNYFEKPIKFLDLKRKKNGNFLIDEKKQNALCIRIKNKEMGKEEEGYLYYSF